MAEFKVTPITKLSADDVLTVRVITAKVLLTRRLRLRVFLGKWLIYLAARIMGCGFDVQERTDA
jgi:hypothetical protein